MLRKNFVIAVGVACAIQSMGVAVAAPQCSNVSTEGFASKWLGPKSGWDPAPVFDVIQNNNTDLISGTYKEPSCFVPRTVSGRYLSDGKFTMTAAAVGGCKKIDFKGTILQPGCNVATVQESWDGGAYSAPYNIAHACYVPSGETTPEFQQWGNPGTGNPIPALFKQSVTSTNYNWGGRALTETFPQPATDTCWYSGSVYSKAAGIPGELIVFPHKTPSSYLDSVGMSPELVDYYRRAGKAPCGFTIYQTMNIDCPNSDEPYIVNTLYLGLGITTVSSKRAGSAEVTQRWGAPPPAVVLPTILRILLD